MRLIVVLAVLVFAMPMTGFGWAAGSNVLLDPNLMCKKTRRLRGKLAEICRHDSALLREIVNGINLGFRECEFQFKNRRWNCTTLRKSMRKILMKDTRETGFVNAITAAGVTYAVTKACTMGNLVECSCDKNYPRYITDEGTYGKLGRANPTDLDIRRNDISINDSETRHKGQRDRSYKRNNMTKWTNIEQSTNKRLRRLKNIVYPEGEWKWGGCGDNINFGFHISKRFLDARNKRRSDIRTMVKLHNNNAGRVTLRDSMRLDCKCHGLSGSCTIKTCWVKMAPFREVAYRIKEKFDGAFKVIAKNSGDSFMPEGLTIKPPTKHDLVYSDESPDFCRPNYKTGSVGTFGRECNGTSEGVDGCELLCCSRGYDHKIVRESINCKCVFKWCCEVICSTCTERREVNTCR